LFKPASLLKPFIARAGLSKHFKAIQALDIQASCLRPTTELGALKSICCNSQQADAIMSRYFLTCSKQKDTSAAAHTPAACQLVCCNKALGCFQYHPSNLLLLLLLLLLLCHCLP
jgi:hypothetical protein